MPAHVLLSDWLVNSGGRLLYDESAWKVRPFSIFYLDDHKLYRSGIIDKCIWPHFPNAEIKTFSHGYDAYWYLESCLQKKEAPNLFITDIHHPGIHGTELVEMIRKAENKFSIDNLLPIIILSMSDYQFDGILQPGKQIYERLHKSDSLGKISECVSGALRSAVLGNR